MAGCTSSTQATAPVRVDAMVTWIERVHLEAEADPATGIVLNSWVDADRTRRGGAGAFIPP